MIITQNHTNSPLGGYGGDYGMLLAGNTSSVAVNSSWVLNLPPTLPSGEQLVITQFRVEMIDADAVNEITDFYWYTLTDAGIVIISSDGTDRSVVGTFTYDIADTTIGDTGWFTIRAKYRTNTTSALEFYLEAEYYYS